MYINTGQILKLCLLLLYELILNYVFVDVF